MRNVVVVIINIIIKWGPKSKRNLLHWVKDERQQQQPDTNKKVPLDVKERLTLNPDVKQKVHILCIYLFCKLVKAAAVVVVVTVVVYKHHRN